MTTRKIKVLGEEVPEPLCSPQISQGLLYDRTRIFSWRGRRLTTWYMAHRLDQYMFCARWAVVEAMSVVPFQQLSHANFAFRLYMTSQCFLHYFFFNLTYSFMVYYTSPVNITSATCTLTILVYDVWTLLPARWSDTSTAGRLQRWQWEQRRRLPFWVTLPMWSVKESPSLSWIHVVQGVWSSTFDSVNELTPI
jgi:hypothetical protein